jgi:hypothetical protein
LFLVKNRLIFAVTHLLVGAIRADNGLNGGYFFGNARAKQRLVKWCQRESKALGKFQTGGVVRSQSMLTAEICNGGDEADVRRNWPNWQFQKCLR